MSARMISGFIIVSIMGILQIVMIVVFIWYHRRDHKYNKARATELADWASARGFNLHSDCSTSISTEYPDLVWLQKGRAYNIIQGVSSGYKISAFDFWFGDAFVGLSFIIITTRKQCSQLLIQPKPFAKLSHQIHGFRGVTMSDKIHFESAEFDGKFNVQSFNTSFAYDILNQKSMDLLLNSPNFNIEFSGNTVVVYNNHIFSAADFEAALQLATGILDNLPDHLTEKSKAEE